MGQRMKGRSDLDVRCKGSQLATGRQIAFTWKSLAAAGRVKSLSILKDYADNFYDDEKEEGIKI